MTNTLYTIGNLSPLKSIRKMWPTCEHPDWMLWLAHKLGVSRSSLLACATDWGRSTLAGITDARPLQLVNAIQRMADAQESSFQVKEMADDLFAEVSHEAMNNPVITTTNEFAAIKASIAAANYAVEWRPQADERTCYLIERFLKAVTRSFMVKATNAADKARLPVEVRQRHVSLARSMSLAICADSVRYHVPVEQVEWLAKRK